MTHTGLPSTSATSVFSTRCGGSPRAAAAAEADLVGVGIIVIGMEREGDAGRFRALVARVELDNGGLRTDGARDCRPFPGLPNRPPRPSRAKRQKLALAG